MDKRVETLVNFASQSPTERAARGVEVPLTPCERETIRKAEVSVTVWGNVCNFLGSLMYICAGAAWTCIFFAVFLEALSWGEATMAFAPLYFGLFAQIGIIRAMCSVRYMKNRILCNKWATSTDGLTRDLRLKDLVMHGYDLEMCRVALWVLSVAGVVITCGLCMQLADCSITDKQFILIASGAELLIIIWVEVINYRIKKFL